MSERKDPRIVRKENALKIKDAVLKIQSAGQFVTLARVKKLSGVDARIVGRWLIRLDDLGLINYTKENPQFTRFCKLYECLDAQEKADFLNAFGLTEVNK